MIFERDTNFLLFYIVSQLSPTLFLSFMSLTLSDCARLLGGLQCPNNETTLTTAVALRGFGIKSYNDRYCSSKTRNAVSNKRYFVRTSGSNEYCKNKTTTSCSTGWACPDSQCGDLIVIISTSTVETKEAVVQRWKKTAIRKLAPTHSSIIGVQGGQTHNVVGQYKRCENI